MSLLAALAGATAVVAVATARMLRRAVRPPGAGELHWGDPPPERTAR